ncbi:ParB N-terminal domain-containing protein, partial [Staphylococcus epidermidis]|uniref:ParB N-terminal domain-containing protein n=1 Tax=Staphylococcus epidermidis TaxID=1282 RepID=UPI00164304EE
MNIERSPKHILYTHHHTFKINNHHTLQFIPLQLITPNPYHPPNTFQQQPLNHLPSSIQQHPILHPILLRQTLQPYYIVLPHPPFTPSNFPPLTQLPPIIKQLSHQHIIQFPIIQNLQTQH